MCWKKKKKRKKNRGWSCGGFYFMHFNTSIALCMGRKRGAQLFKIRNNIKLLIKLYFIFLLSENAQCSVVGEQVKPPSPKVKKKKHTHTQLKSLCFALQRSCSHSLKLVHLMIECDNFTQALAVCIFILT